MSISTLQRGLAAVLLLISAPGPIHGQEAEDSDAAVQRLKASGEACYRRRDYRCALDSFEAALALKPNPAMRFNVASAQDKLGFAALAITQYRRYLEEAGSTAPRRALAHITRRLKILQTRVARLSLTVSPADASISLNGLPLAARPRPGERIAAQELVLEPGPYRLDISHPRFTPQVLNVKLKAGEQRTLALTLEEPPQPARHGALALTSVPDRARIWLDDELLDQQTPATLPRVKVGLHTVRVQTTTHRFEQKIEILPDQTISINAILRPVEGSLRVTSEPAGATVTLNGEARGHTPLYLSWLPGGEYALSLTRQGFVPWKQRITLTSEEPDLELTATLPRGGPLSLSSEPAGAEITLDGEALGRTPGRFVVAEGSHELELTLPGYLPHRRKIHTSTRVPLELSLTLAPQPEIAKRLARRRTKKLWAITTLALGCTAATGMTLLYSIGKVNGDDSYQAYRRASSDAERTRLAEEIGAAEDLVLGGHVLLGVSAASLGLALYQWLTLPQIPAEHRPAKPQLSLAPLGAGLGLTYRGAL